MQSNVVPLRSLTMIPNPVLCTGAQPIERNLFCKHYGQCLDLAIERKWQGFSCVKCQAFVPECWDAEDRKEDEIKCMALLLTIFASNSRGHFSPRRIAAWLESESRWFQEYGGTLSFGR